MGISFASLNSRGFIFAGLQFRDFFIIAKNSKLRTNKVINLRMFGEEATVTIPKMKRAEVTPPLIEELRKKTP